MASNHDRDSHDSHATEQLLERLQRVHLASTDDGVTWEDLRLHVQAATRDDGVMWDDVALAVAALRIEGERPVPAGVAERHLAAMHAALDEIATAPGRSGGSLAWRRRLAGATAAVTAFTAFGGGAVAVAQEAVPGDVLYGMKRASEQVRLVIERDPAGDAELHLGFAEERLTELQSAPGAADELLENAFDHLARAEQHGNAETHSQAQAAGVRAIEVLNELLDGKLPETASPRARESLERARDRRQAHVDARSEGATGRDQAPGLQRGDDAPGPQGGDGAPGRSGDAPTGPGDAPANRGRAPEDTGPDGS
ncbi:MAG TPA: DUF5667 domain-containing protein [Nitriliruptorales bacterium]